MDIVAGDKLSNYDELLRIGESFSTRKIIPVRESKSELSAKIFALSEEGSTALGPALTIATGLAGKYPKSEIIVATDGLSNVGVGITDLEGKISKLTIYNDMIHVVIHVVITCDR